MRPSRTSERQVQQSQAGVRTPLPPHGDGHVPHRGGIRGNVLRQELVDPRDQFHRRFVHGNDPLGRDRGPQQIGQGMVEGSRREIEKIQTLLDRLPPAPIVIQRHFVGGVMP